MNCKEFLRMIPGFLQHNLDYPALRQFSEHMENCSDCKEEFTIQFLVTEGVQRLEEGDTFDLQKELNQKLEEAKRTVEKHKKFSKLGIVLELVAVWIMLIVFVFLFI